MRRSRLGCIVFMTALLLFVSSNARAKDAGENNAISATLDVLNPVTIGGTTVKPGSYTVKADETTVTILARGKTVAQAKVQWKDSAQKAQSTNLLADNGMVKEIHFSGKTKYVELTN